MDQVRRGRPLCGSSFDLTLSLQTLLVDGYISQTFRSRAAGQFFLDLLERTSIPPHMVLSYSGREGHFFFTHSVPSHIPIQHSSPPDCWLLDCGIVDRGTVVPQRMWSPHSALDRARHVVGAQLQMPIFFEGEDRSLGIPLVKSTNGWCNDLRDANHPAPLGPRSSTYIRIVVSKAVICVFSLANFVRGEY
jgi:hypothetical protein